MNLDKVRAGARMIFTLFARGDMAEWLKAAVC